MRQQRRHFSREQKAQVVRRHLSGKAPVSNLADEFGIQPSQLHAWVKQISGTGRYMAAVALQ
jgi:transposase